MDIWSCLLAQGNYLPAIGTTNVVDGIVSNTALICPDGQDFLERYDGSGMPGVPANFTNQWNSAVESGTGPGETTGTDFTDPAGTGVYRCYCSLNKTWYDTSYGVNGNVSQTTNNHFPGKTLLGSLTPGLSQHAAGTDYSDVTPVTLATFPRAADTVFLFDGIFMNLANYNYAAFRVNARHNRMTKTNVLYLDGHAETLTTGTSPGGSGSATAIVGAFTNNGNDYNTAPTVPPSGWWASHPLPLWRDDQQTSGVQ
jgi:prepilin-type processing-associated H-X9-DG protein